MTSSTVSITPGTQVPGAVSLAETPHHPDFQSRAVRDAFARATRPDYFGWLATSAPPPAAPDPIRLSGDLLTVDGTHRPSSSTRSSTSEMPDGAIYKPCGNRRASVCPSCSTTYQYDAYQLLRAGLVGGKGVPDDCQRAPDSVRHLHRPLVRRRAHPGRQAAHLPRPETVRLPRRTLPRPPRHRPHRRPLPARAAAVCFARHETGDPRIGQPFCLDCYDHDAPRRVEPVLRRTVAPHQTSHRTPPRPDRETAAASASSSTSPTASAGRCRRYGSRTARSARCRHAAPCTSTPCCASTASTPHDPDAVVPPPAGIDHRRRQDRDPRRCRPGRLHHPDPSRRPDRRGRSPGATKVDIQDIDYHGTGEITDRSAAGYLAKYATKVHRGHRAHLDPDHPRQLRTPSPTTTPTSPGSSTPAGDSSRNPTPLHRDAEENPFLRLENWAHMLGFGGHFLTKAPRYSATFGALRAARDHLPTRPRPAHPRASSRRVHFTGRPGGRRRRHHPRRRTTHLHRHRLAHHRRRTPRQHRRRQSPRIRHASPAKNPPSSTSPPPASSWSRHDPPTRKEPPP